MDHMTTLSAISRQPERSWLRAYWPALLLPVLAAEMIGLARPHVRATWATPWLEVVLGLTVVAVIFVPAAAARVAPFALFAYGFVGLLVAHYLLLWQPSPLFYGVGDAWSDGGSLKLVLPEAFAFMVASLWLLVATGGPGGTAVRRAVHQLRGTRGEQRTVPALLLLPVLGLWEEAVANPLWYGGGSGELAGFRDRDYAGRRRPGRAAAAGRGGRRGGRADRPRPRADRSARPTVRTGSSTTPRATSMASTTRGSTPAAPGAFSGMYGPVLLDEPCRCVD